jgi:hypothetical protein
MRDEPPVHASRWFQLATVVGGIVGLSVVGDAGQERPQGTATRRPVVKADYSRVFAMDRVHELRIRITAEQFGEMQRDLSRLGRGAPSASTASRAIRVDVPSLPAMATCHSGCGTMLGRSNHWIGLALQGTTCNRDAVGARISWSAGGRRRSRLKTNGGSYLSSHDAREVLGLGPPHDSIGSRSRGLRRAAGPSDSPACPSIAM